MDQEIIKKISEYDHIAIYRHVNPDFDAFGSQLGMYDIIKTTYPNKNVYVCGDFSSDLVDKYSVDIDYSKVDYSNDVLAIILDTANRERIDDDSYLKCKEIIKIDHHVVVDSYGDINYEDSSASSASQLVARLYKDNDALKISKDGAAALYLGIVGDTSRFLYRNTDERTFDVCIALLKTGIDIVEIYNRIYLRSASELEVNKFILNNYQVEGGVAYYILTNDDLKKLNISRERGSDFVNILSGIKEYKVWMAITENVVDNNWRVSIRSRDVAINQVAAKYNGGGHVLASGAKLEKIEMLPNLINDLTELIDENLNDIFSSFIEGFSMHSNVVHESDRYAFIKAFIITVIIALISEYALLIPLNPRSPQFILYFSFLLLIFTGVYFIFNRGFNKIMKYSLILAGILIVLIPVGTFISSPIFNAKSYQKQLVLDKKADFYKDNKTISYESIPVVDRESAIRLGDRKLGEMVDYVSQFEVDQSYEQINYKDNPYRVTPLEYSDLIKWFTNHGDGLPAYIRVNMVSQESEVVKLKEGMKYSKSDHFGRKIERHLRANYPSLMFDTLAFEINDDGIPYWIAPVYEYKIGLFGGKDIVGAVLVNAINGDHDYYDIKKVPEWVDRVYPSNLILTQLENYGKYTNGYLNTLLSQKCVLQPTDGYNYIAINDDVYLYTGLTSVSKDASNVGFAMINLRTKDGKFYNISS
ncbi:MAG: DHH family phosphoesterase [Thomasclavelia sp.]